MDDQATGHGTLGLLVRKSTGPIGMVAIELRDYNDDIQQRVPEVRLGTKDWGQSQKGNLQLQWTTVINLMGC